MNSENKLKRINALRAKLAEHKIYAAFITSTPNIFYISGFTGMDGDAALLITPERQYILSDSRYTVQIGVECPEFELVGNRANDYKTLLEILKNERIKKVAFENERISFATFMAVTETVKGVKWIPMGNSIEILRNFKDEEERELSRKACQIGSKALDEILPLIKPGVSEVDIACELEYRMRKLGASGTSFDTIFASGYRSAMPHGAASDKIIEVGDPVTIDFGCKFGGYCSDMTRTFFVGEASDKMREIYEIVYKAQTTAIKEFKVGMVASDMDKIARDIIADAGYGEYFGHSLGHGCGIEIHEGISVSKLGKMNLVPGNIFSVEPGIYVPDVGGVRIEDLVYCTEDGLDILTADSKKELAII